jgi:hypothetical protein
MEYVPSTPPPLSTNGAHSSPQPASPLLRLPGKIRNRIYEYVFSNQEVLLIKDSHGTIKLECLNGWYKHTALSRTCRQIHEKIRLLSFKYCDYLLCFYSLDYLRWMERLDQEVREIVKANIKKKEERAYLRKG